jgi:hypothetical protein
MVIKGKSFSHAIDFARHLMRTDQNDLVEILELDDGLAASSVESALVEFQTIAETTTNAQKGLYQASINPQEHEQLTREQWTKAIAILEEELGLKGQPRVVVLHEKEGREHVHIVWQRAHLESGKVISDSHNYEKHERAARKIEREFALEVTRGVHVRVDDEPLPIQKASQQEVQQGQRSGLDIRDIQKLITPIYENARTGREFIQGIEEEGYYLARGDNKNIYMLVDPMGESYRLSSALKGHKMSGIKKMLADIPTEKLQTVSEAIAEKQLIRADEERAGVLRNEFDKKETDLLDRQQKERERLEAKHALDAEFLERQRKAESASWAMKFLQDITGYTWYKNQLHAKEDREQEARQKQEMEDLKQLHKNETLELDRERQKAFHALDEETKPDRGNKARFEVDRQQEQLNVLEERLKLIAEIDQKNYWKRQITSYLEGFIEANKVHLPRIEYHETIEAAALNDIEKLFKDRDAVYEKFKDKVNEKGMRKTTIEFVEHPEHFGKLKSPPQDHVEMAAQKKELEIIIQDVRKAYYLEKKTQFDRDWYADEDTILYFQEQKRKYDNDHSKERLAAMRLVQQAATKLTDQEWRSLSREARHEITVARDVFKDGKLRAEVDAYIRDNQQAEQDRIRDLAKQRERERERELNRDNIDPNDPDYRR